jgi:alkanesulfonate monooxygenase SsuD/methylene tetrahydromethanopterin reductase-like flavin-dependent oxidoreductase (luciferase family)
MDTNQRIGVAVNEPTVQKVLNRIYQLESYGIDAAWLTTGGARADALSVFPAAAVQTDKILMGTSIIPIWPRHPISIFQQVKVISELAPNRFRLGIGPSHKPNMETMFGVDFQDPLGHLKEYLAILKAMIQSDGVDFSGKYYEAHSQEGLNSDIPIMSSALRKKAFELCGEYSDGVITWVCPMQHITNVAIPSIEIGALNANRDRVPPLIVHAPICISEQKELVRDALRSQMGVYPTLPFYNRMLMDCGYEEVEHSKVWSDRMADDLVVSGTEEEASLRIDEMFETGVSELVFSILTIGDDREESLERTVKFLSHYISKRQLKI